MFADIPFFSKPADRKCNDKYSYIIYNCSRFNTSFTNSPFKGTYASTLILKFSVSKSKIFTFCKKKEKEYRSTKSSLLSQIRTSFVQNLWLASYTNSGNTTFVFSKKHSVTHLNDEIRIITH